MKRGFSLIEVIVALAIGGVLLTTVTSVLTLTLKDSRRTRTHSEIMRDAESVTHLMNTELRLAGLGVPTGAHIDPAYGTSPPVSFYGALLVGGSNQIGILADLPRPDANYSAFGALHARPTGSVGVSAVAWHTENNGSCMADSNANTCVAGRDSTFFADNAAGCATVGTGAVFQDRKCPWGMGRVLPGEAIQVAAGDGRWSHAAVTGEVVKVSVDNVFAARLSPGFNAAVWPNLTRADGPGGKPGQGFVTTLDRVFYRLAGSTIVREQCWGDPNPNDADWPDAATNAVSGTPAATGGGGAAASSCTGAEVVARNVSSLAFSYFDASGVAVTVAGGATKRQVRRIDYVIDFAKTIDGRPVLHQVTGSVRLTNLPP